MAGKVTASSEIDVGSCFAIHLPCTDLPFVFALTPDPHPEARTTTSDLLMKIAPTILFIDDNAANIQTTSSYLRAKGYKIVTASDSQAAIAPNGFNLPDVILIELRQSDLVNFAAIDRLHRDPQFADLPIIVIVTLERESDVVESDSGDLSADLELKNRYLAAGANYYLSKPVGLKAISQIIQDCLSDIQQVVNK